ncbi:3-oxoacyl-[acyl-carrier-protein] synthase III C-terminal domain-containing protein [Sporosarcina limicola]|uniref:3-oxoacyl-[acyl-carrier-protein] synthase III n=1 Tax=Sporosarcina limicola TaxID=34101 RepID=A0A927MTP6_9BACL|nr:3-oxoacyl-[acyl-carrier-protein] synthase III C-terminal domain-containing protein [Sporosarcina limicola]MBE1557171.1 3-oxoacyl-[acyl-carrier-protein] synthase III [Sporosarcina limicola]
MEFVGISGIKVYSPSKTYYTRHLLETGQMTDKLYNKIGVSSVQVSDNEETPTDLAIKAANIILDKSMTIREEIDLVIYVGATPPDYLIWSPSSKICYKLGLKRALGFEMMLGCGGFQIAMKAAKEMLLNSKTWKKALIVGADKWEQYTTNRTAAGLIFGDAGAAILLEKRENARNKLMDFFGFTDGSFHDMAFLSNKTEFADKLREKYPHVQPNEYSIFNVEKSSLLREVNLQNYIKVAKEILEQSKLTMNDISYLLVPTGRKDLMIKIIDALEFDQTKTNLAFLENQGDLGAPGFVCDLHNMLKKYNPKSGEKILTLSAGVGITWLGSLIEV